jgi:hypothetical protein
VRGAETVEKVYERNFTNPWLYDNVKKNIVYGVKALNTLKNNTNNGII